MVVSRDRRLKSAGARRSRTKCHSCRFLRLEILFIALAIQKNESMPLETVTRSTSIESDGFPFNQTEHVPPVIEEREKTVKRQTRATGNTDSEDKIFFPDDEDSGALTFAPEPAPECKKTTFCEKTTFYPAAYISKALKESEGLEFLVRGVDQISPQIRDVELRIDMNDEDTMPLCRSIEQVVYPRTAQNRNQEWLFIVNQDYFKQGIRIETCASPGGECSVINRFAEGYATTCKQKYIYRQLAAISKNGTTMNETFKLPSSCCCQIKLSNSLLSIMRIGPRRYGQTPVSKFKPTLDERDDKGP